MAATLNGSSRPLYRTGFPFVIPGTSPRTNSLRPNRFPMLTFARLSVFAIAAGAVVSSRSLPDLNFIEALSDSFWTYALLGLSSIVIEELAPVFGGIAAHEGELQLLR